MMTNDEKLELLDTEEGFAWNRLRDMDGDSLQHLEFIDLCQRIRKAIPKDRVRLVNEDPSPHRAGVEGD